MPKRGENIHKRKDGRWEGRYIESYTPTGKAHYKSIYGASYQDVKNRLRFKRSFPNPNEGNVSDQMVEQVGNEWLEAISVSIKPSTYARYLNILQRHIYPYFKMPICNLTNEAVNIFVKTIATQGRLDGRGGLSAKTIHDIVSVLIQLIRYAEKRDYIYDFQYDISLPKLQGKELKTLSPSEQEQFLHYIAKNPSLDGLGILIALFTGIRLGELCALTWGDIDFETGILKITKTIQRIKILNAPQEQETKTALVTGTPKSKKSVREIPLPMFLLQQLQGRNKNKNANDYILSGDKRPLEPRTYQKRFKHCLKEAGLPPINFHALRHSFATRAIEANFDVKSLSEILGHSTVRFTLDRYVHSSNDLKRLCMERLIPSH